VKVGLSHPPLRLALGPDAVDRIRHKHGGTMEELQTWEAVSQDTQFVRTDRA
jgi:hypothetical protein